MPKTTVAGHPLHPQLITAPSALLPYSLIMDVAHRATGNPTFADVAYYTMIGGFVGGLAAGAAGAADYLELPRKTHTKQIANLHASLNIGILGLYSVNLLLRRKKRRVDTLPLALSVIGTAGLVVSAWYGGHLVYEHGVRVKGRDPIGKAPAVKPPGDELMQEAFHAAEHVAPKDGPETSPEPKQQEGHHAEQE